MLEDYNPWWNNKKDPIYLEWLESPIKWIPDIVSDFTNKAFSLNFLVGPRQVGKSTALRIFIHKQLKDGFDPNAILFLSCDSIVNFKELASLLNQFLKNIEGSNLIILDEITFVRDWWRAIKDFIDRKLFVNTTIYVSGSASMELIRQKEYFPGRRGSGKNYQLLPMDFNTYCRHIGNLKPKNYSFDKPNIYSNINKNKLLSKSYIELYDQYLKTGGFPHPIIEYKTTSQVTSKSYRIYIDWIRNDLARLGKSESFFKEIIFSIINSGCAPISYQGIAKNTSIGSVSTISSYLDLLSKLFVIHIQRFRYIDGQVSNKKNKKIHVQDPFLLEALSRYVGSTVNMADKVESCVSSHMARLGDIFYWRANTEVDVITIMPFGTLGIEVKWSNRIRKRPNYKEAGSHIFTLNNKEIALFLGHYNWSKYTMFSD